MTSKILKTSVSRNFCVFIVRNLTCFTVKKWILSLAVETLLIFFWCEESFFCFDFFGWYTTIGVTSLFFYFQGSNKKCYFCLKNINGFSSHWFWKHKNFFLVHQTGTFVARKIWLFFFCVNSKRFQFSASQKKQLCSLQKNKQKKKENFLMQKNVTWSHKQSQERLQQTDGKHVDTNKEASRIMFLTQKRYKNSNIQTNKNTFVNLVCKIF